MMTLQLLSTVQILLILCTSSLSYPVFGTKRYNGRSPLIRRSNSNYSWGSGMQPYTQFLRAQRFPINYYEMYPYSRDYQDEYYYPQETISYPSYPMYIPPPRTSKYEVYQAVLPYYYGSRPDYGYYGYEKGTEPVDTYEDDYIQDAQREEREEAQPIGQEVLYENDGADDNIDDVNAAFLQNLIVSQMYKDANTKQKDSYDSYGNTDYFYDDDNYGKWEDSSTLSKPSYQEDEDVRELKQLVKPQKSNLRNYERGPTTEERLHLLRKELKNSGKSQKKLTNNAYKRNWDDGQLFEYNINNLRSKDKAAVKTTTLPVVPTTVRPRVTSKVPMRDSRRGQKEEVLMRPAVPIKNPFSSKVLEMMKEPERKREPSVYDTIKHMLDVEKSLENNYKANEMRSPMRKRIITDEESLVQQLSLLKKSH